MFDEVTNEKRLTEAEQSTKSAHHRIDELETEVKDLRTLTLAVHDIASNVKHMDEKIDGIDDKLDKQEERVAIIENKPAKRLDGVIDTAIKVLIGAIISYFITKIKIGG